MTRCSAAAAARSTRRVEHDGSPVGEQAQHGNCFVTAGIAVKLLFGPGGGPAGAAPPDRPAREKWNREG